MGVYDPDVQQAREDIRESGDDVLWVQVAENVSDATKPWIKGKGAKTEYPVKMLFLMPQTMSGGTAGSNVIYTGTRALMEAVTEFIPENKDTVIRDGQELTIKKLDPLKPGSQVILWKIEFES